MQSYFLEASADFVDDEKTNWSVERLKILKTYKWLLDEDETKAYVTMMGAAAGFDGETRTSPAIMDLSESSSMIALYGPSSSSAKFAAAANIRDTRRTKEKDKKEIANSDKMSSFFKPTATG